MLQRDNAAALASGNGGAEGVDAAGVQVLESSVDFMALLYCHLTACPPHGPFVYYAALTLVERARRRYEAAAPGGADIAAASSPEATFASSGVQAMGVDGVAAVLRALTIPNVVALIEKRYDTTHLSSWPLLYVPAEIRGADVDALMQQQAQLQR